MANIPIKWGKVGTDGKAEVNGADNTTFSSSSPAFKVNGDEEITGNSSVGGDQSITGNLSVGGNQSVTGNGSIGGNGTISGNLIVYKDNTTNKVGINVASPTEALDVSGNIKASGNVTAGGNIIVNEANVTNKIGINQTSPDRPLDVTGGGIKCQPGSGGMWIQGCAGNSGVTGLYVPKQAVGTAQYIAALTLQTKTGGAWAIGNYDNDQLVFSFGTKANIDSDTNTVNSYALNTDGSFNITAANSTKAMGYTNQLSTNNTTDTWVPVITGSNFQHRVIPTNYNTAPTSDATANRVMSRDGNGDTKVRYIYTTHVNQSSSDQTTTYDSTSGFHIYCNTDGWLRKAKAVTQLYSGSLAPTGQCSWANYKAYSKYLVIASLEGGNATTTTIVPRNTFTSSRQASSSYIIADDAYWCVCYMWYSGTTGYLYMEAGRNDCRIKYVFGLN